MQCTWFLSVSFFTCQSDFDAGTVPPSPRIRHHSEKNDHTNFPLEYPENTVSQLGGNANTFSLQSCGLFLFSSWIKMYYFIVKSCAPSKTNNTGEHFRAGSSTYWRHTLNGYSCTCSRLRNVSMPVKIRFFRGFQRWFDFHVTAFNFV